MSWNRRCFMVSAGAAAASISTLPANSSPAAPATVGLDAPPDLQSLIDAERQRLLATLAKEGIAGAAVCLIHEGKPAWVEGFGSTDAQSAAKVTTGTIFNIESTSKNFTTVAILLAVQQGLLDLDQPISAYLPDFRVHSRFERRPESKITLRLLLSHRAGFTHEAPVGNNYDAAFADFETHARSISQTWLRYPVGQRYEYSNLGFDLAGYILQTVAKMPFAQCLKRSVFEPLGMSDSTASPEEYAQRSDRAVGHQKGYDAVPSRIPLIPSGGVYTSARDMAAYLMFHLNQGQVDGKAILDERLWKQMHGFSFGGNYSLGIARAELRYGDTPIRLLNHNGGGFGFGCVFNIYPQAGLAWAVLFNDVADPGYQIGAPLQRALLTRQYGEQKARLPVKDLSTIEPLPADLEKFVGNWRGRAFRADIKIQNGSLGIPFGTIFAPLRFTSPGDLFIAQPVPLGESLQLRYFPGREAQPAYLEASTGDASLNYNDGPQDLPGQERKAWDAYLGDYTIQIWGKPSQQVRIHRKNGYLYLDDFRLIVEFEPGLFFASDGEAVDFRHTPATWRNVRLIRS
jgi:CubicO group peptidase (beta-lactamase class C family)